MANTDIKRKPLCLVKVNPYHNILYPYTTFLILLHLHFRVGFASCHRYISSPKLWMQVLFLTPELCTQSIVTTEHIGVVHKHTKTLMLGKSCKSDSSSYLIASVSGWPAEF